MKRRWYGLDRRNIILVLCSLVFYLKVQISRNLEGIAADEKIVSDLIRQKTEEYCNRPETLVRTLKGEEGTKPGDDFVLLHSALLIRHGSRLSISRPPVFQHSQSQICPLNFTQSPLIRDYVKQTLLHQDIIMSSSNNKFLKTDLIPNPCSQSSITNEGIEQMLALGKYLGNIYLNKQDLRHQRIEIGTTNFSRTFQSLFSFMYGMSPMQFGELVKLPVGVSATIYLGDINLEAGNEHTDVPSNCAKANTIRELRAMFRNWDLSKPNIKKLFYMIGINNEIITQSKIAMKRNGPVNQSIGQSVLAETSPSRVWDWMTSEYFCKGETPPCLPHYKSQCFTISIMEDLIKLVNINNQRMVQNYYYAEATSLAMYPFLKNLNEKFNKTYTNWRKEQTQSSRPLWIVSTHDVTIGPLFISLGVPIHDKVPYASRVIFELWVSKSMPNTPYVKLLLNGKNISHLITFCHGRLSNGLCPLLLLNDYLNRTFLQRFGANNYSQACKNN